VRYCSRAIWEWRQLDNGRANLLFLSEWYWRTTARGSFKVSAKDKIEKIFPAFVESRRAEMKHEHRGDYKHYECYQHPWLSRRYFSLYYRPGIFFGNLLDYVEGPWMHGASIIAHYF